MTASNNNDLHNYCNKLRKEIKCIDTVNEHLEIYFYYMNRLGKPVPEEIKNILAPMH